MSATDQLCIDTVRTLAIDTVQKANSGHPGLPLGAAPMAYVLWQKFLKHDPKDPSWADRDRFVLSAGHGSTLLYALMHLTGYASMPLAELQRFRQWKSKTPGHPENFITPGVEATTGPLGQGTANAVGMALAERALANLFNRPGHTVVDHWTYALVSDGDLMEGISAEAASIAGHLKLGKLVYLYDANDISLDGPTSITFTEDVGKRYEAYGWQVLHVSRGDDDLQAIDAALRAARADTSRPSLIVVKTTIGFGSPNKAGTSEAHGSPLGADEVRLTKQRLGWDPDKHFFVPDEAAKHFREGAAAGEQAHAEWRTRFDAWAKAHPELAKQWQTLMSGELPADWDKHLPTFKAGEAHATRVAGGKALNALARAVPWLIGGDADLSVSTNTGLADVASFDGQTGAGRNLHFGVREHAMAGIANGIAYHKGLHPYVATFFVFSDYMRPSVRLAALAGLPVTYVWTHDSVGLGEDGPTHQPVEHLMSLRAMPNLVVLRPGDANETVEAWRVAMQHRGPVGLVLSRQKVPVLDRAKLAPASGVRRGAYVLADAPGGKTPEVIVMATGSELPIALAAWEKLTAEGVAVRLVSMPSWELFAREDAAYREQVLPKAVKKRVSIEAGVTFGWKQWVGDEGVAIGVDTFGHSAPAEVIYKELGLTAERVVSAVKGLL